MQERERPGIPGLSDYISGIPNGSFIFPGSLSISLLVSFEPSDALLSIPPFLHHLEVGFRAIQGRLPLVRLLLDDELTGAPGLQPQIGHFFS